MSQAIEMTPRGPVRGTIRPPGSKSLTNRALVCAALARGRSILTGALDSEDTRVMIDSLNRLGIPVRPDWSRATLTIDGAGGQIPVADAELFLANSGTSIRFLTALVTLGQGRYRLDGVPRMRQRPIADLLEALQQWGADVQSERGDGCPPVIVQAGGLPGGPCGVRGDISSQFLSGLLLAAPCAQAGGQVSVAGPLVSQPYVRMTLAVMRAFGVPTTAAADLSHFQVPACGHYQPVRYEVEPDASAASYFWAAAAISGGQVTVQGLSFQALQGDVAFCNCLARMGCHVTEAPDGLCVAGRARQGIDVKMNAISDTVQTLAAVALFADSPTTISGVGHIRHKETDRIGDLARELRKLGATVEESTDGLRIIPGPLHGARLATYQDHRMAMSLALVGLRTPGVWIEDPACTAKTYPRFFDDLARLCANPES